MVNLFDPYDPYMTFEAKPLIKLVATNILVILIKLHDHATWSVGGVAFWKFGKYDTFWPLNPLGGVVWQGHHWLFQSSDYCLQDDSISF